MKFQKVVAFCKTLLSKDKAEQHYAENSNIIHSASVSRAALKGHHIEVAEGAFVDANCTIDSFTFVGPYTSITKTSIGRFCSIAGNVSIGMGEHLTDCISTSSLFYKDAYSVLTQASCNIGHDVWIGVDAIILRGVTIGDGAIIGANSVVNKDIPPYAVVVGSPARIIKYRFTDEEIEIIRKSCWWQEDDLEMARQKVKELSIQLSRPYYG